MRSSFLTVALVFVAAFLAAAAAKAGESSIGEPVEVNGMNIGAVYLQPVMMSSRPQGAPLSDIHLEADIGALAGNENGFAEGAWIPYLGVAFSIEKIGTGWSASGSFVPMVASDGPHYGDNVKLDGVGKYRLTYTISPPVTTAFPRHTDKETGTAEWWAPFDVSWEFTYLGTGKKGGY